jgi:hypothetical protein
MGRDAGQRKLHVEPRKETPRSLIICGRADLGQNQATVFFFFVFICGSRD